MRVIPSILILLPFFLLFEGFGCSSRKISSSSVSPNKSTSSTPLKVDLSYLKDVADVSLNFVRSPMRVLEKNTKKLALDFDSFNSESDEEDASTINLFYPESASIYTDESWTVPLFEVEKMKNLMNLEAKMKKIRKKLDEELLDHAKSLSWVSDAKTVPNYVAVVSVSLVQLNYLISRLNNTPNCSFEVKMKIIANVTEFLKSLEEFCNKLIEFSGKTGFSIVHGRLSEPTKYFEALLALRDESDLAFDDEMFKVFIDFLFEAYSSEFSESLIKVFLEYTRSDKWAPLPITFMRNRFSLENQEQFNNFVKSWTFKAFGGAIFDTRHLVNLGELMQQGFLSYESFSKIMDLAKANGHQSQYKFDENLIKFLTFTATTPYLLPNDPETAILLGNFASPKILFEEETSDEEKIAIIENYWEFFVAPADFSMISKENYENLCLLIQKLDKVYPGISEFLWENVNGEGGHVKAKEFYENLLSKMIVYREEIDNFMSQAEYFEANFTPSQTVENCLADSKSLYLMLEFFSDILSDTIDAVTVNSLEPEEFDACKVVLDGCVNVLDIFLMKHAHKTLMNFWYEKMDYFPTRLLSALADLWVSGHCERLTGDKSLIWENLNRLVDHNLAFARNFMTTITAKTAKYGYPAFSGKTFTPKCLIESGEADALNLDYFRAILEAGKNGILSDFFFYSLSEKLANEEISFKSAGILFSELAADPSIQFDMTAAGYTTFWNPYAVTNIIDSEQVEEIGKLFNLYLRIFRTNCQGGVFSITTDLLKNISSMIGFGKSIRGRVNPHGTEIEAGNISQMVLSREANERNLDLVTLSLFDAFVALMLQGLPMRNVRKIFEKLIEIGEVFKNYNLPTLQFSYYEKFIYAYNSLTFAILRIPEFTIVEEEKKILTLYEVFRKCSDFIPEIFENLSRVLKNSAVLVTLYSKIINNNEILPAAVFENPLLRDKKTILRLQNNYIRLITSEESKMRASYIAPMHHWVRTGKMDPDAFIKLMAEITPNISMERTFNFIPLLAEFIKAPQYPDSIKVKALNTIFSENNDEIIRTLCNRRTSLIHESLVEIFLMTVAGKKFFENCKQAVWYEGFLVELSRLEKLTVSQPSWASAQFSVRSAAYLSNYLGNIGSGVPNYKRKFRMIKEADLFIDQTAAILPLLRKDPALKESYQRISALMWEISTCPDCYFRVYAKPETYLNLLNAHVSIFMKTAIRTNQLKLIVDSISIVQTRRAAIKMLPMLVSEESFVLTEPIVRIIYSWFSPALMEDFAVTFETFILSMISEGFKPAKSPKLLDEMLSLFIDAFQAKFAPISLNQIFHFRILDGLLSETETFTLASSDKLMEYLRLILESLPFNEDLSVKVMSILKDRPEFYLKDTVKWSIIWKQLYQAIPMEFIGSNLMKLFVKLDSTKLSDWKQIIPEISAANLPSKILIKAVEGISEAEDFSFDSEILLLLPKALYYEDFESFEQVEHILGLIESALDKFEDELEETDEDDMIDFADGVLEKFILLIDFESGIGQAKRDFIWKRIFKYILGCYEYEEVLINLLLTNYPNLIKRTTNASTILSFIYEFEKFETKGTSSGHDQLSRKLVEIYNEFYQSENSEIAMDKIDIYTELMGRLAKIHSMKTEDLGTILNELKVFSDKLGECQQEGERQDELATLGFNYTLTWADELYKSIFVSDEILAQICDLIVKMIHSLSNSGRNLISLIKSLNESRLSAFVMFLSEHVQGSREEYSTIIRELMKFAAFDVADLFYQQISDRDVRPDVCFFTREIISQFAKVTDEGFNNVNLCEWPELYIDNLIENRESAIDVKHYEMIEHLMAQIDKKTIRYANIYRRLSVLVKDDPSALVLVEKILSKNTLSKFYSFFMVDSVIRSLFASTNSAEKKKKCVSFIKNVQKIDSEAFEIWKTSDHIQAETRALLEKSLQEDQESIKLRVHTNIAEKMIHQIEETDFTEPEAVLKILSTYKNLDVKSIEPVVLEVLVSKLMGKMANILEFGASWTEAIRSSVTFMLAVPSMKPEIWEIFMALALRVFNEEIFVNLCERTENAEALKVTIQLFKSKIDTGNLKAIKTKLARFGLAENEEILLLASRNSEPSQLIEYFQASRNISLDEKLRFLSACKLITGNEKVSKLINYYKTLLLNNPEESKKILLAVLENNSVLSCFTSQSHANKTNIKNKSAVLGILQSQLDHRKAVALVDQITNPIGKLLINLYFKASSTSSPLLMFERIDNPLVLRDFLLNYLSSIEENSVRNKTSMYLKSFRVYEEIESKFPGVFDSDNLVVLNGMIDGLFTSIQARDAYIPSFHSVYAVYKLSRRLSSKKRERYAITRKLLLEYPRTDCISGFLQAQVDSGSIDWELHKDLKEKTKKILRIRVLFEEFERNNLELEDSKI